MSLLFRRLPQRAIVDIADRDWPPGQRSAKPVGEFQRHTRVERGVDRLEIGRAGVRRHAGRGIGQARRSDDLAGTLETEAYRHLHALALAVRRRRRPARAKRREEIDDVVEIMVRLPVFCDILLRRHALDRQLQVFPVGIINLGNARPVIEHAAKGRRARLAVEHAAGRMRERRGIDLAALPGARFAGNSPRCRDQDGKNDKTLDHAAKMMRTRAGIKSARLHFLAFIAERPPSSPGLTGRSSIPETVLVNREAAAYWVPRSSRGTTRGAGTTYGRLRSLLHVLDAGELNALGAF